MKIILLFFVLIALSTCAPCDLQCLINSQPIEQRCNYGYTVNRDCCVTNKAAWYTELVPLDEIDTIQIAPYSCANPSFCDVMFTRAGVEDPFWGNHNQWRDTTNIWPVDDEHGSAHFSGAQYSCGNITFIFCKHRGNAQWECYGKFDNDNVTMIFTQALQCVYAEVNNRTMLQVGSCVINQASVLEFEWNRQKYRPYTHLSSTNTISFTPILNPYEVDALRGQNGINRIIRRTDAIMGTAYLPIPPPPAPALDVVDAASFTVYKNTLFWVILASCLSVVLGYCCQRCFSCMINAEFDELKKVQSQKASCDNIPTQDAPASMYPSPPIEMSSIEDKI